MGIVIEYNNGFLLIYKTNDFGFVARVIAGMIHYVALCGISTQHPPKAVIGEALIL